MLDKVKSGTAARIAIPRSGAAMPAAADSARAQEIAPIVEGHGVFDDGPRRDPPERPEREETQPGGEPGSGAAVKRAIDEALKSLLGGAEGAGGLRAGSAGAEAATLPPATPTPHALRHGRAAGAYGLQADLREPRPGLRPGTVFSERF